MRLKVKSLVIFTSRYFYLAKFPSAPKSRAYKSHIYMYKISKYDRFSHLPFFFKVQNGISKSIRLSLYSSLRRFNVGHQSRSPSLHFHPLFHPYSSIAYRDHPHLATRYQEDAKSKRRIDRWGQKERQRERKGKRQVEAATTTGI